MSFEFGNTLRITLFGQSHADAVGVVIDGLPAGEPVDMARVKAFLARRAPGGALASARREADEPELLSGLVAGKTCGAPLCGVIRNTDQRPGDYDRFGEIPRPSHADYPALVKHGPYHDLRGGGYFSARLTAPLCLAGAVCMEALARRSIHVGAHLLRVGKAQDAAFDPVGVSPAQLQAIAARALPVLEEAAIPLIQAEIEAVRDARDSIGGVIECAAVGLPAGLGSPPFRGVENLLSAALFAIPALRGVEFGAGFAAASMAGSAHNDAYYRADDAVKTRTNHHGGVLGGLTSGMPLLFRVACKPTSSIGLPQETLNLRTGQTETLCIAGRHDPCVALRAVPCVEAAAAIVLLDLVLERERGGMQP